MKTNPLSALLSSPLSVGVIAAGMSFPPLASQAQVVIEGGPGVIQISDRDGKPEPVVPGEVPQRAPIPFEKEATPPEGDTPRAVTLRPDPRSEVTVRVPVKPAPRAATAPEPGSVVAAVPTINVEASKRKAEILRELNIADSGTAAKIAILTENLYEKDSAQISRLATPSLALLAEFIRLSPHREILVTYQSSPTLHVEKLAWDRSVSLVEWMKSNGRLSSATFTVNEPIHIVEAPDTSVAVDAQAASPFGRVELVITYR